jgi:hypothetical protein
MMKTLALLAGGLIATGAGAASATSGAFLAPPQQGHGGGHGQGSHAQQGGGRAQASHGRQGGGGQAHGGQTGRGHSSHAQGGGQSRAQGPGSQRSGERHASGSRGPERRSTHAARPSHRTEVTSSRRGSASLTRAATAGSRGSGHRAERMFASALDHGRRHGMAAGALRTANENGRVRLTNRNGDLLFDMSDDRAREIGAWQLRRLGDRRPTGNAPAFCRSGEGHPVWGRQWCLDKGFGLGSRNGTLWSRGSIDDVIFRRVDPTPRLDRGGLLDVLGDIVLGRLALQAVTLGYDQPLSGTWLMPDGGPRILRLSSGGYPVAEFVDVDRDARPEVLYVIQPL